MKFKPATFYLEVADFLAKVVEGSEPPEEERIATTKANGDVPSTIGGDESRTSTQASEVGPSTSGGGTTADHARKDTAIKSATTYTTPWDN